jgi:ABC-type transporter Mla subunit MlaD
MDIHPGTKVPGDVRSSIQIANDLGEQVVDLVPAHGGTARRSARAPACRWRPIRSRPTWGRWSKRPPGCLQAIPAGDLNKLIGELATALKGGSADLRTIISAGTTFSQEFVAYEQQFTELLANAPTALNTVTAVAPELKAGPGEHGGAPSGAGRAEDGTRHPLQ